MSIAIGKQIRAFRLRSNLTQEQLAEQLHVTAQSVSKWENDQSCPDIALLPELSALLGVTIDELFDSGTATHLRRIEQMLDTQTLLPEKDLRYAERQLRLAAGEDAFRADAYALLAQLYNNQADGYRGKAEEAARAALTLEPERGDNHKALYKAMNGFGYAWDWCCVNHTRTVDFYRQFTREHPAYALGYLWLLDGLILDGRLDEAADTLEQMRRVRENFLVPLYRGWIAFAAGRHDEARDLWDDMVEQYPDEMLAWSSRADTRAKCADWAGALADYRKAASLEMPPRYTDNLDSIAQICLMNGDRQGAVEAWEQLLAVLRDDWQMTEGEEVDSYREKIRRIKAE